MRAVLSTFAALLITAPVFAAPTVLTTLHNRHVFGTSTPPDSVALELELSENGYDFLYHFPDVDVDDLPASFSVDKDEFFHGLNHFGVSDAVLHFWWNNFNRWMGDGVPSGDSTTLTTRVSPGGFSTSKECLAGVVNCDNAFRTVETDFNSINGVDFAGQALVGFELLFERVTTLPGNQYEAVYTLSILGVAVPEPGSAILALLGVFGLVFRRTRRSR